jgi:DNA primase large subunit
LSFGAEELGDLPFIQEAGELLIRKGYGLSMDELVENWSEPFVAAGVKRARDAVMEGRVDESLNGMAPEQRILSFVVAALVVRATGNQYAIKRFALAEAKRLEERVFQRIRSNRYDAAVLLSAIYSRILGMSLERVDRTIGPERFEVDLGLRDYLSLSSSLDASKWGIVNRVVVGGRVYMKLEDAARLLRSGIADRIERRVSSMEIPSPPAPIAEAAAKLSEEIVKTRPPPAAAAVSVSREQYPPCIRSILKRLEAGENLPHSARFLLATFMVNIGMPTDDVIALFSRSPDFNERVTRYQVEHIAGLRGGKRYSVPACPKLVAQGLCARDDTCDDIRNPISYLRRRPAGAGGGGNGGTRPGRRRDRISEDEL